MQLSILGHMIAVEDGIPIRVSSPKQRTLLALLATNAHQPVSTTVIMHELWPEQQLAATPGTLRTHIFQLRRTLLRVNTASRGDILRSESGGYVLTCDVRLDSDEFKRQATAGRQAVRAGDLTSAEASFEHALSLWRGPVLDDVPLGPHLQTLRWELDEIKKLTHRHRADGMMRLGLHRDVLPDLAGLVQAYPLDEGIALQYISALHLSERRAEALAYYDQLRRQLSDVLGLDPSERLQKAYAAIVDSRFSIDLLNLA